MQNLTKKITLSVLLASTLTLSGCGYNTLQAQDEQINASWSEVLNQYKRRADLVDQLVPVVQGYASHEQQVLTDVIEARAKAGSIQLTADALNDPAAMQNFQEAQAQMTSSLSRLMAVSEQYPNLKADALFQDLQAQIEGTENRIGTARGRYIEEVKTYNTTVRQFPTNLTAKVFGMQTKANFSVENERTISEAPTINFGNNQNTNNQNTNNQNTSNQGTATAQ